MSITLSAPTLTPIASVDTSSASNGVCMFSLYFDPVDLSNNNVIQFEYRIYDPLAPLPPNDTGFLPLENAVSSQGIMNQYSISIPSNSNDYNPASVLEVALRVYFGSSTSAAINVTEWSNACPLHNAPPQPTNPVAYIVPGEVGTYYYDDMLYVQIADDQAYIHDDIKFIVSFSYKDQTNTYKWYVSDLLDWTRHTFSNTSYNAILIDPVQLTGDTDLYTGTTMYVAVNAVYSYTYNSKTYHTVSEISDTVEATVASIGAPTLDPIVIPTDYAIYNSVSPSQTITLNWAPPSSSLIPVFTVASYTITVVYGGTTTYTVENLAADTLTYDYVVESAYLPPDTLTSTELSFTVTAVFGSGALETSNAETVNTFEPASEPRDLIVNWASIEDDGDVDFSVSFKNPITVGYGTPDHFVLSVYDASGSVVATQNEPYVANNLLTYTMFLNSITTTTTGSVRVHLVTTDTNETTATGLYADIDGANATANYVASSVPIILNVNKTVSNLTFDVISQVALARVARFDIWDSGVSEIVTLPFFTNTGDYYYDVIISNTLNNNYLYRFDFQAGYFNGSIPNYITINCANSTGIGSSANQFV